jgi:hypothetical protein
MMGNTGMCEKLMSLFSSAKLFLNEQKDRHSCLQILERYIMHHHKDRLHAYSAISTHLACLSDSKLINLLAQSTAMHTGIGGKSFLLMQGGHSIFIKKIPITDRELLSENRFSTANIFDLPLFYQYGVGSAGFGAWRELAAHVMTTNWVLSKVSESFPLMYHWRILPTINQEPVSDDALEKIYKDVAYWENSTSIQTRLESIQRASFEVVVFLEFFPQTLSTWLDEQLCRDEQTALAAILFVDESTKKTNQFMNSQGLLHFDAHFENILTDGQHIYVSDFGLALSSSFELSSAEIEFFSLHERYDDYATLTNLLFCIFRHYFGQAHWEVRLKAYLHGKEKNRLPAGIDAIVKRYATIALTMDDFFQKLQKTSKLTPYPVAHLDYIMSKMEAR